MVYGAVKNTINDQGVVWVYGKGHLGVSFCLAAVVIAITHKHTFCFKEQSILTSRAVFANNLTRFGILDIAVY